MFSRADRVISSSRFERAQILQSFEISANRLVLIQEGIAPIPHAPRREPKHGKTILCVSRFEKYKGIQHIITALLHLPELFTLTLIGSGPYANQLHELVQRLNLQKRVVMKHGVTEEELYRSYLESDVAVLLSQHEAYSLFIGEALSVGVPCVVANRDALVEWVDGESCIGVDDPANPEEVVEAILRVAGRRVNRGLPKWDDYARRLVEVYEEVLQD